MGRAPENVRLRFIEEVAWQRRMRPVVDAAVGQASCRRGSRALDGDKVEPPPPQHPAPDMHELRELRRMGDAENREPGAERDGDAERQREEIVIDDHRDRGVGRGDPERDVDAGHESRTWPRQRHSEQPPADDPLDGKQRDRCSRVSERDRERAERNSAVMPTTATVVVRSAYESSASPGRDRDQRHG